MSALRLCRFFPEPRAVEYQTLSVRIMTHYKPICGIIIIQIEYYDKYVDNLKENLYINYKLSINGDEKDQ